MNYKLLFWIAVVIIIILVAMLWHIKSRVDEVKTLVSDALNDAERIFYEMTGYLREAIIGGNTERLRQQFEYSVDKLGDAIKARIPEVDIQKFNSLKKIIDADASTIVRDVSASLKVPENTVSNFVTAVKSQIQNIKAGQNITATINHEDANSAAGQILSALRSRI